MLKVLRVSRLGITASLISVALVGCGRDTSTPSKTLIGHWVAYDRADGAKTDYCFSSNGKAVSHVRNTDTIKNLPYTIQSESPSRHTVEVATGQQATVGYADRIVFAPDGQTAKVSSGGSFGESLDRSREIIQHGSQLIGSYAPTLPDPVFQDWQYVSNDPNSCR